MCRTVAILFLSSLLLGSSAPAGKKLKPWTEWNERDARRILNESAWGQTQVEMNISEMFYSPTTSGQSGRSSAGAMNRAVPVNFRIRLLSAKPVRQAFMRSILLAQRGSIPQLEAGLKSFVERNFDAFIAVAVDCDSEDRRLLGPVQQAFQSATADLLRNNTYLETRGGKRTFLHDYQAPAADGLGAKFIFPRTVDGQPVVAADSPEVRFYAELGNIRLNMRFKVADFMYEGVLEY